MRCALAISLALLVFVVWACGGPKEAPKAPAEDLAAQEAHGISLLERYDEADLAAAVQTLGDVVKRAPEWRDARVNFALALAATKKAEETTQAIAQCDKVLAADPWEPHALFVSALVHRFKGKIEEAVPLLERLREVDPDEASVWYWLGTLEMERDAADLAKAEQYLRRAVELAPGDLSAAYGLSHVLGQEGKGDSEEAKKMQARFEGESAAKEFGSGALVKHGKRGDQEYGEAGKYARAIRDFAGPSAATFSDATKGSGLLDAPAGPATAGIACGDFDADGFDGLYVPSATGSGTLYRNDHGRFVDVTAASGLPAISGALAALFADVDEDGRLDLTVVGADGVRLFRNLGAGKFEEVPAASLGAPKMAFEGLCWTDLDHDGDLDLVLAGARPQWLRNRRDGTFADVTAEKAIEAHDSPSVVAFDADGDGVTDLVFFGGLNARTGEHATLLRNGRLGPFVEDHRLEALGHAVSGTVGDLDGDGHLDLLLVRPDGAVALARGDGHGAYALDPSFPTLRLGAKFVAVQDFDNDGHPDVLTVGRHVSVIHGLGSGRWRVEGLNLPDSDRSAMAISDVDGDGDLDVVLGESGSAPRLLRNESPRSNHAMRLRLRGVPDRVQGRTWSNVRGIGADVEVKAKDLLARRVVLCGAGFPGQATTDVVVGLGERSSADFVTVHWTDGVLQSEYGIAPDAVHEIVEVNRKLASCPVVFAWDGKKFQYVTDCLGVGGLAFYSGPPVGYAPPDPTEVLRLPPLEPVSEGKGKAFVVNLVENLEEVSYLDEARLLVVDHPATMEVHPDERFAVEEPMPQDRIYGAEEKIFPVTAVDDAGRDVRPSLLEEDRKTVDTFRLDPRFIGLAETHSLVLDFGDALKSAADAKEGERLVMFLSGWVEYGYSKTYVGSSQAGFEVVNPTIEMPDGARGWKKAATIGYPAGNSRTITYDVTAFLGPNASRCRIRTNLEVYWDRIFVAHDHAPGRIHTTTIPVTTAHLHDRGYPREFSPDGRAPNLYDYSVIDASIPFFTTSGDYTRIGDVTPLVTASDDQFVIFGKGEEVSLHFDAAGLPPLRPGQARTFMLRLDGYCKDRDPYTGLGATVGPLPFHAMSNYPYPATEKYPDDAAHREYRARWNTRTIR